MSSSAHEDEDIDTVPSILVGHEQQRFALPRGPTPDPERPATQHYKDAVPGTRRDSTLTVTYKSPDWNTRLKRKMEGKWIEVPFSELAQLVPGKNPTKSQTAQLVKHFIEKDFKKIAEDDMYPILCTAFNAVCATAKSTSWFKDVADQREGKHIDIRPDLVMYSTQAKFLSLYTCDTKDKSEERRPHIARCNWALIQAFVECKTKEGESAFHFADKKKFLRLSQEGEKCQAQIAKYAAEIQLRQHRRHVWSFYFAGPQLRIQRWDRSACMVSTAVNFQKDPSELVNFLYRFSRLTPEQLGYDVTAVLALPKEVKMIANYATDNVWLQKYKQHILESQDRFPVYKVAILTYVDDPSSGANGATSTKRQTRSKSKLAASASRPTQLKNYLIGQPVDCHSSPVGRATKGFVGFDMDNRRMVFIKDQWRPIAPGAHPEVETYERLRKGEVGCVATCLGGSDVFTKDGKVQRTLGHEKLPANLGIDNCERHHTRLVLQKIGRPLFEYPNSPELITIVYHAYMAHNEAWEEAKVLHRDVSAANIMIDVESTADALQGFLTDWDMCKYKEDLTDHVPALPGRSGTWQYMSVLSLQYPKKPQELADDLESFVYILSRMAIRFHRHNLTLAYPSNPTPDQIRKVNATNDELAPFVTGFFDAQHSCEDGYWSGGAHKRLVLEGTSLPVILDPDEDGEATPLAQLLNNLYTLLRRHYAAIDYAELKRFRVPQRKVEGAEKGQPSENEDAIANTRAKLTVAAPPKKTADPLARVNTRRARARAQELAAIPEHEAAQAQPSASVPAPKPQKDHINVAVVGDARRVLDTHEEMLQAFERVLYKKANVRIDLSKYNQDKWYDQLDGLKSSHAVSDQNPSGNSDKKRKAIEEAVDEEFEREETLSKRVKGETFRAW